MAGRPWRVTRRTLERLLWSLGGLAALVVVLACVLVVPQWLVGWELGASARTLTATEKVKAINDVRATLLQGIGGFILLAGAAATWRQIQISREQMNRTHQYNLQQLVHLNRGQSTERYTRAIDQLGSDQGDVRIGGIYALEQIARDEEPYHGPIIEVLTAYVRGHAPKSHVEEGLETESAESVDPSIPPNYVVRIREIDHLRKRAPDLQAVMTVLGRRTFLLDPAETWEILNLSGVDLSHADLHRANLCGVDFSSADLSMSFFREAKLDNSHLNFADFRAASFVEASVTNCNMHAVDLRYSYLVDTNLSQSLLQGARLNGANLEGARLEHCYLHGADFRGSNLEKARLTGAKADAETQWPTGFDPKSAGVIIQRDEFEDLDEASDK
jgi:Pentapeptide repeats (8 copies)